MFKNKRTYADRMLANALKKIEKSDPNLRKKALITLPKLWWLPAFFRDKVLLQKELEKTKSVLNNYAEHAAMQAQALKDLYMWALANDPKDGSLETFKTRLGPLNPNEGGVIYDASQTK